MDETPSPTRREFLAAAAAGTAALTARPVAAHTAGRGDVRERLRRVSSSPVVLDRVELLRFDENVFVRTRSRDGIEGVSLTNGRDYLVPLMADRIIPSKAERVWIS
jgi:hypothetical protein